MNNSHYPLIYSHSPIHKVQAMLTNPFSNSYSQCPIPNTQYPIRPSQYPMPNAQCPILNSQFSILPSPFSLLHIS